MNAPDRLGFRDGLRALVAGARFVYVEHRDLARYWVPPLVITLGLALTVGVAVFGLHDDVARILLRWHPESAWLTSVWAAVAEGLGVLIALMAMALAILVVALLSSMLAAPFNDGLSSAVERRVRGEDTPPWSLRGLLADLGRSIRVEASKWALGVLVFLPLWLIAIFVPVVGPILQAVVGFFLTSMFFALDYIDWPASRRGLGVRARFGLLRGQLRVFFGFGAGVHAVLWMPMLNLFFMPAAVAGGTLLFLALRGEYGGLAPRR